MTDLYPVKPEFAAKARITREQYLRDYQASIDNPDAFWGQAAERLHARLWLDEGLDGRGVGFVLDLGGVQPGR